MSLDRHTARLVLGDVFGIAMVHPHTTRKALQEAQRCSCGVGGHFYVRWVHKTQKRRLHARPARRRLLRWRAAHGLAAKDAALARFLTASCAFWTRRCGMKTPSCWALSRQLVGETAVSKRRRIQRSGSAGGSGGRGGRGGRRVGIGTGRAVGGGMSRVADLGTNAQKVVSISR